MSALSMTSSLNYIGILRGLAVTAVLLLLAAAKGGRAQCPNMWPMLDELAMIYPDKAADLRTVYCEVYEEVKADNPCPGLSSAAREQKWIEETVRLIHVYSLVKLEFYRKVLRQGVDSVGLLQIEAEIDKECEARGIRRIRSLDEYLKLQVARVKADHQKQ